jgi:hypothetical protein
MSYVSSGILALCMCKKFRRNWKPSKKNALMFPPRHRFSGRIPEVAEMRGCFIDIAEEALEQWPREGVLANPRA